MIRRDLARPVNLGAANNPSMPWIVRLGLVGVVVLLLVGVTALTRVPVPAHVPVQPTGPDAILLAAGDIADCTGRGDAATAQLLSVLTGTIATLGDTAYESGTAANFSKCYDPTWGQFKDRTRPAPGNHDYYTTNAVPYYQYFGAAAGDPSKGYYSYDLGKWHIIVVNSNCGQIGGCHAGSPEELWLESDLAAHQQSCTLAYWHHPLYSSGAENGPSPSMRAIWQTLYNYGADVVLNGHDHDYERFAPQGANSDADPTAGIREFVVGTGGKSTRVFGKILPNSEVHNTGTFGILKLVLHPASYDWQFMPIAGLTFTDAGHGTCHLTADNPQPTPNTQQAAKKLMPYHAEVLADKPVGYWPLTEADGTLAADSAGGEPGAIRGGVSLGAPGPLASNTGAAMNFDGSTGYVRITETEALNLTGDLTVEAWVKPAALNKTTQAVVHNGGGGGATGWQYRLGLTSYNFWRGTVFVGGMNYTVTAHSAPSTDHWSYLVMTRSGNTLALYVDGIEDTERTVDGALNSSSSGILAIGRTGGVDLDYFNGSIAEVAVYDKALSQARVFEHYTAATAGLGP
ncbi:MAG: LamG-like jellyroll fold domain-containing protein [Chloroflexia bacterium]